MNNIKAYKAEKIFTGYDMLHHHAIIVNNDVVTDIVTEDNINFRY